MRLLLAVVLVFVVVIPEAPADAAQRPALVASAKARKEFKRWTGVSAERVSSRCRRPEGAAAWRCRSRAWGHDLVMDFSLRVRGGVARVVGAGAIAAVPPVIPLERVARKSDRDTKRECKDAEIYFRRVARCEGWWGGSCKRHGLSSTLANIITCTQTFFMSAPGGAVDGIHDKPRHIDCKRKARYVAPKGKNLRITRRGTQKWRCKMHRGTGSPPS